MKKTIKSMIAMAALSGTVAANVHAEEMIIKKGDTLWDISQANQISVGDLKEWNQLSSDLIFPGDSIEISPEKRYSVQSGESLWSIAKKHNVTVEELIQWNELKTDLIHPDQVLVINENNKGDHVAKLENKAETKPAEEQPVKTKSQQIKPATAPATPEPVTAPVNSGEATSKEISVTATAYTASCEGCSGITATGINLIENPNAKVISVDPNVIPLGSKVHVEGYGDAIAGDTGGSIKGNKIDIFIPTKAEAIQWGKKTVKVKILN